MKLKFSTKPAAPKPVPVPSSPPSDLRPLAPFLTDRHPTHEEIAAPARILWRKRGCPQGCDDEIWLEAERSLISASSAQRTRLARQNSNDDAENAHKVEDMLEGIGEPSENRSATSL
jgi:hypothetical protein